jgi:YD repeat-containing protein
VADASGFCIHQPTRLELCHQTIAGNAAVHDAKGNLTEYEINSKQYEVEYDLDNRIIKVDVDSDDVEYRYDALGRRVIRKEGSTKTALIWWVNSENAEYEQSAGQFCNQNDIMSHPSRLNAVMTRCQSR